MRHNYSINTTEFDDLVDMNRRRCIEINRLRADLDRQHSDVVKDNITRWGLYSNLAELNKPSVLLLHQLRRQLVQALQNAEQRMLEVCEIMFEEPLRLLVFIPAASRLRGQTREQVMADITVALTGDTASTASRTRRDKGSGGVRCSAVLDRQIVAPERTGRMSPSR